MTARYLTGTVLAGIASLPDDSVDLVMTSPPFLALRSYLTPDHPDKGREFGSEPTPGAFIDNLLDVVEALDRVVAPHGSIVFELGDTYAGSGGAGGDYNSGGLREDQQRFIGSSGRQRDGVDGWPLGKSKCLIPELFAIALAYGRNPITGRETAPWRIRNVVAWCRPTPPVGALGDKFRPATSYLTIACKSRKRYFDLEAVRGPGSENTHARTAKGVDSRPSTGKTADDDRRGGNFSSLATLHDTNGAPPLDYWEIPTAPYKGTHYATFPPALCVTPILAMSPEKVCTVCGEPSRRMTDEPVYVDGSGNEVEGKVWPSAMGERSAHAAKTDGNVPRTTRTTGWTDCGHDAYRRGMVLDPFAGSGTTLQVATGHGRDAIGIDINPRNVDLARERIGMFLEVC